MCRYQQEIQLHGVGISNIRKIHDFFRQINFFPMQLGLRRCIHCVGTFLENFQHFTKF